MTEKIRVEDSSDGAEVLWSAFAVVCVVLGLAFLIGAALVDSCHNSLAAYWQSLGLGGYAPVMLKTMENSLLRGGLLFLFCGAVFILARGWGRKGGLVIRAIPFAVVLVLFIDLVTVDKRYVIVWDEGSRYRSNELIEQINSEDNLYRASLPVRSDFYAIWRAYTFYLHGIAIVDPGNDLNSLPVEEKNLYVTLSNNPLRLWEITSVRHVIGPSAMLGQLIAHPAFETGRFFDVMRDGSVVWTEANRGQQVWLRFKHALPRALVYHNWEQVEPDKALSRLADPAWNPAESVLVLGSIPPPVGSQKPSPAVIRKYESAQVKIEVDNPSPGILLLNDKYDADWKVRLDGKPARLLKCNYIMRGVEVPAGRHRIVFTYRPYLVFFVISISAAGLFLAWMMLRLILQMRRSGSSAGLYSR